VAPPPNLDVLLQQMQFPGMPMPESDVFREWLVRHGREYDRIEFQVRLGDGIPPDPRLNQTFAEQAVMMTQKRADAIAWQNTQATIIEAKIRASLGAMGQLLGYGVLYQKMNPASPPPRLLVVARRVDSDTAGVFEEHNIGVTVYEDL
jgi:hypothetical protein